MGGRGRGPVRASLRCAAVTSSLFLLPPAVIGQEVRMAGDEAPLLYSGTDRILGLEPTADPSAVPYAPGRLIVRVKESVADCLDCVSGRGRAMGSVTGSAEIDALNRRFGLRAVRALRRAHATVPTLPERMAKARERARRVRHPAGAMRAAAFERREAELTRTYVFELSPWLDMHRLAREYERLPEVEYAEPDLRVHVVTLTDDPFLHSSGTWANPFDDLWGIKRVAAPAAWDVTRGEGVVVAVIDTGVDLAHPDLAGRGWVNPAEIPGNGLDDDDNGYVDDLVGWDFPNDDADPFDDHGHGTHVAGTVLATGSNGLGVVGVAYESRVMSLKGISAGGSGTISDLVDSILYAAENGARVINASWGGFLESQTLDDAIEAAHAAGVVFVAAAGNSNIDVDYWLGFSPADHVRAITVSASDHLDARAFFSNFGAKIDVAAPGGGGDGGPRYESWRSILSLRSSGIGSVMDGNGRLVVEGDYVRQAGTSMAAPHVAGVAALVLSAHPEYSPEAVRQALRSGADDVGPPDVDPDSGYGVVNAANAVVAEVLDVDILSPAPGTIETMADVAVRGRAMGDRFASFRLDVGAGEFPTTWQTVAGPETVPVVDGDLGTWPVAQFEDGPYMLRVVATNTDGMEFERRIPVTLDRLTLSEPEEFQIFRPTGPIAFTGTASGPDFASFRIEWRVTAPDFVSGPWNTSGVSLVGSGAAPLEGASLGWLDPAVIRENSDIDFRLVVARGSGQEDAEEVHRVVVDPTLRPGWPQQIGAFPRSQAPRYWDRFMRHLVVADLDLDGSKEILVAYGDTVHVYQHDGSPLPGWPKQLTRPDGSVPFVRHTPAVGDLDGDGRPEIVIAEANRYSAGPVEQTHVFHADGTPMTGWPKVLLGCFWSGCDETQGGEPPRGIAISDVDGDGSNDLVIVMGPTLQVRDAQGNLLAGWPRMWPEGDWPCIGSRICMDSVVAVGDMDGDGTQEIAAVGNKGNLAESPFLLLYDAQGRMKRGFPKRVPGKKYTRTAGWTVATKSNGVFNQPVMADLDGDGDLEIVTQTMRRKLLAVHHNGRRLRLRPRRLPYEIGYCGNTRFDPWIEPPAAGDLDGDGAAEVVVGIRKGRWKHGRVWDIICLGYGSGPDYFQALKGTRGDADAGVPGWPFEFRYNRGDNTAAVGSPTIADVDGDGVPDVVTGGGICVVDDPSRVFAGRRCFTVHAFDRNGNVLPGFPKATPGPAPGQSVSPAVADLDGDGLKEIVWLDIWGHLLVWNVPGTPAPEVAPWPMYRQNPALTGAVPPR